MAVKFSTMLSSDEPAMGIAAHVCTKNNPANVTPISYQLIRLYIIKNMRGM